MQVSQEIQARIIEVAEQLHAENSDKFPFNKNFYLIVNLAMGGVWGGDVDPNFTSSTFEIDYIRVYN